MPEYTVVDIGADRLESGYPIVRMAAPDVSFEQWLAYARAVRRQGGILGLAAPDEILFGLATYERRQTPKNGPVLSIDLFVVFELARCGAGRRVLLDGVEERAKRLGCPTLLLGDQTFRWNQLPHDASAGQGMTWNMAKPSLRKPSRAQSPSRANRARTRM